MKIAVIGATGTAGSHTATKLTARGVHIVEVSRSHGVDLISGEGLREALDGVDVAIDTSNAFPSDEGMNLHDALTAATRNVVDACSAQRVGHLVFLSISGVENPMFDDFPYYVAKRAQEQIVASSTLASIIVKSTQWYEFATNPAAVTFGDDAVQVADWLIQPIAVDTVADVLIEAALDSDHATNRVITGPQTMRLPDLTTRLLRRRGDPRPIRVTPPQLSALAQGVLLAPEDAEVLGPDIDTWLETVSVPN
jgi:uncharacterized protein YbjT (DUF2867 family)